MLASDSPLKTHGGPSKHLTHNRVVSDFVVSFKGYGDDYPLESLVFIQWFGVPFSKKISYKGIPIEKGSSRLRNQRFDFYFSNTKGTLFVLAVDDKKGFANLPKELRSAILQTVVGPRQYGVIFDAKAI